MFGSWFYILICIKGPCEKGQEILSSKSYYTQASCEEDAKLIATHMWYPKKAEWGYRCEQLTYTPPKVEKP